MIKLRSREKGAWELPLMSDDFGSMAATAIAMAGTIFMVAEFRQGVKCDLFNVLTDSRALCPEYPQPGSNTIDFGIE